MVAVVVELVEVRCQCGKLLGTYAYGAVRFYCSKCGAWTECDTGRLLQLRTSPGTVAQTPTAGGRT